MPNYVILAHGVFSWQHYAHACFICREWKKREKKIVCFALWGLKCWLIWRTGLALNSTDPWIGIEKCRNFETFREGAHYVSAKVLLGFSSIGIIFMQIYSINKCCNDHDNFSCFVSKCCWWKYLLFDCLFHACKVLFYLI